MCFLIAASQSARCILARPWRLTKAFALHRGRRHLTGERKVMQMTKQEQLAKAERDLEGILSRLFSEKWADWNSPKVQGYLEKTRKAFGSWMHANTHDAR